MSNIKYLLLIAMVAMTGMTISSCSNDDEDNNSVKIEKSIDEAVEGVRYTITDEDVLTASEMADEVFGPSGANSDDPELEQMRAAFLQKQQQLAEEKAAEVGANGWALSYKSVNFKYESEDEQGNPITLSAKVYWGVVPFYGALDPDYIVLCPHFTIGSNPECPTSKHTYEAAAITGDNLLIMPDYKGFGETKKMVQPYVNHELCAINSIDALKAGYKVFTEQSKAKMEKNWKLYVIGASQGGGNALAIHKWFDTHLDEAETWRFEYSYCCAGPHNPALTFQKYFEQKKHPYPCVFPFTIKAMMAAYPDILGKWTDDDFYSEDFVENHKALMDEMVASKEYNCDKLNAKFFEWYPHKGESGIKGGKEILLTDILSPEVLDTESEIYKALFMCLEKNDLTKGWTPVHKIKLYHGKADEIVPYANSEAVKEAFPDMVEFSTSMSGTDGHVGTCVKWLGQIMLNAW